MIQQRMVFVLILACGCASAPPASQEGVVAIRVEGMTKTLGLT
ncbi:MAG: hypothetical protein AAB074_00115 [Planctomycetota bacterium]